jgi:hypothetical protein
MCPNGGAASGPGQGASSGLSGMGDDEGLVERASGGLIVAQRGRRKARVPLRDTTESLDRARSFGKIAAREDTSDMEKPVEKPAGRRIVWVNVMTVLSAAILIGAEVFGAAFAGGWAIANLFDLGPTGGLVLRALLFVLGLVIMVAFIRNARRVEPFTQPCARGERHARDKISAANEALRPKRLHASCKSLI